MRRGRIAATVVAALVTTVLLGGMAAHASLPPGDDVIVVQPFAADSGDRCPMGATKGTLGWHLGTLSVDVAGTVADHPLPGDTNPACAQDGRSTTATFTASAPNRVVRRVSQQANDGQQAFKFSFPGPVQAVTVQVCRHGLLPTPPDYCGPAQRYPRSLVTTG